MNKKIALLLCITTTLFITGCDNNKDNKDNHLIFSTDSKNNYIKDIVINNSYDEVLTDMSNRETNLDKIQKIDRNFFDYYYSYENNKLYMHISSMSFTNKSYPMIFNYGKIIGDLKNNLINSYNLKELDNVPTPKKEVPSISASNGGNESSTPCVNDYKISLNNNKEENIISDLFALKDPQKLIEKYNGESNLCINQEDYKNYRDKSYSFYLYSIVKNKTQVIKKEVYSGDLQVPKNYK